MPFTVPGFVDIRATLLRDIQNLLPDADTSEDSDYYIRATSVASAAEGLYEHQKWITRQIFPDTADTDYLGLHCALRQIFRKPAVSAAGMALATGTAGVSVTAGLIIALQDGRTYTVTTETDIGQDGTAQVPVSAVVAGVDGNVAAGAAGTIQMAPQGVDSAVTVGDIVGGVETETDPSMLARLLDLLRRPPAGGNQYDYRRWALEVAGVNAAYVYPLRRGLGTVDVAITTDQGLPSQQTIDDVQAHIDEVRPVTAKNSIVLAPDTVDVDFEIQVVLDSITLAAAQDAIEEILGSQFAQLQPGQDLIRSRSEALVSSVAGIKDRSIVAPAANVTATVDDTTVQWLRLGTVTVSLMP